MAYIVTINSISYGIISGSLQITDNINDRSTCSFDMITSDTINIGSEVVVINNSIRIFGGKIKSIKKSLSANIVKLNITCSDFNSLADQKVVGAVFEDENIYTIFNTLVSDYLVSEGVTTGSMVADVTVSKAVFNYKYCNDCFSSLNDITNLNYNIDYYKSFTTFYREDNTGTAISQSAILELDVETNQLDYRNKQYLRAGQDTTQVLYNQIPTPKPDGESKTFLTRFAIAKEPVVRVNGVTVSYQDIGINRLEENKQWYWSKGDNFITQDSSQTTLSETDTIDLDYQGLVKIIVATQDNTKIADRVTVEGGTGLYEKIEDQASIDLRSAAQDFANGLIDKYDIPEIITLKTEEFRQAGEIVNVQDTKLGVNGDYLIESVDINDLGDGTLIYQMKLLSGESFGSWVEFFRKLRKDSTDFLINENEVLVFLHEFDENVLSSSTTQIKIFDALYPSNTLYPNLTLYPGSITATITVSG